MICRPKPQSVILKLPNYLWRIKVIINSSIVSLYEATDRLKGNWSQVREDLLLDKRVFRKLLGLFIAIAYTLAVQNHLLSFVIRCVLFNIRELSRSYGIMWMLGDIIGGKSHCVEKDWGNLHDFFFSYKSRLLLQTSNRIFFNRARL